jgi:hypothetical protein
MDLTDHWLIMSTQSEYQSVNKVKRVQFSQPDEKMTLSGKFKNRFRREYFIPPTPDLMV